MSWTMWHVCGIGFDCAFASDENMRKFWNNHINTLTKVYKDTDILEKVSKIEADIEADPNISFSAELFEISENMTVSEFIAAVMKEETGINFGFPSLTDDSEDCVVFFEAYPWGYNEQERSLTMEELVQIMGRYADELGVKVNTDLDLVYAA